MPKEFIEKKMKFTFADDWVVENYDDHPDYRKGIGRLTESKAVDFVGILQGTDLFFVEVTDFRGSPSAGMPSKRPPLAEETASKVRSSIAGIIGACRTSSQPQTWKPFACALVKPAIPLRVVLWLEDSRHLPDHKAYALTMTDLIKKNLRWLTTHVNVLSQRLTTGKELRLSVANLSGAGGK